MPFWEEAGYGQHEMGEVRRRHYVSFRDLSGGLLKNVITREVKVL